MKRKLKKRNYLYRLLVTCVCECTLRIQDFLDTALEDEKILKYID